MNTRTLALALSAAALLTTSAQAGFHLMQIEQIIGGINGNNAAQAIQLRTRQANQHNLSGTRVTAWDANGANPVLLFDFTATYTPAAQDEDSILLSSAAFNSGMLTTVPTFVNDFTLTNTIPASYLSGGKVTFGSDGGSIYWSLAFGAYVGTNTGTFDNDSNGDFGNPFASALPTSSRQGIRFTGASNALSTTNVADYALTADPATVKNASGTSFTVVPEPGSVAFISLGALALAGVFSRRRRV